MTLQESSIFIGLRRLRRKLYQAQFLMMKTDRIIYGTPMMQEVKAALKAYIKAFKVSSRDRKLEHLEESIAEYAALRDDIEFCVEENIIHYAKRKPKHPQTATPDEFVNSQKMELFMLVARIDDDMCKWEANLKKGKTLVESQTLETKAD